MHPDLVVPVMILWLHVALALALSWLYFRRYQMTRPPIGVLNSGDIAIMIGGIILIPYLYLYLPRWLVLALLVLGMGSALYFVAEPVLRSTLAVSLVMVGLVLLDLGLAWHYGTHSLPFIIANNVVLLLVVISVTVLWAQSGMSARDAALLGVVLALYDYIFTSVLPFMADLFARLADLPFVPTVAWPVGNTGLLVGIGLGDLLLATVFPLVLCKAFSPTAGIVALGIGGGAITLLFGLSLFGLVGEIFPVMVVLGPLMFLQYLYWRSRYGRERTTWQYRQAELVSGRATPLVAQE
jgi:hypothetical protein